MAFEGEMVKVNSSKAPGVSVFLMIVVVAFAVLPALSGSALSADAGFDRTSPLRLLTNKPLYKPGEAVSIFIQNLGDIEVGFDTMQKIRVFDGSGNVVYPTSEIGEYQSRSASGSWTLSPGESEAYLWDQMTISALDLPPGKYTVKTVSELADLFEAETELTISDMGYVILVAGNSEDDMQDRIDEACNRIYDDLIGIGYTHDRIYYLNSWYNWRVDDSASSIKMEDAIKIWAADKVSETSPLFIVMFDHGNVNRFCVDDPPATDNVYASDLNEWLNHLEGNTNASVFTWYMGCRSGSFINDLSKPGRVTITSCNASENSAASPAPYHEPAASRYWPQIKSGGSLLDAFNAGSHYVAETLSAYHPLLDDNGDGVGHGWDTPDPSGYLPHNGDGGYAAYVYMGGPVWEIPWITDLVAKKPYELPIPPDPDPILIPITAKVESIIQVAKVTACLIPPASQVYQGEVKLEDIQYTYFEMADLDQDGVWSVNIPSSAFAEYANETSTFKIVITAEDVNGHTALPAVTGVEFTPAGDPSLDTTPPNLRIRSPKYLENVQNTITVKALASDDTCVQTAEVYVGDQLDGVVNLPESSNCAFEYELDTGNLTDGFHSIEIRVQDKSGNTYSQSTFVTVVNDAIKLPAKTFKQSAIAELELAKTGNVEVDGKLGHVIGNITQSLDEEHWLDETHLDTRHGHRVFSLEKHAVKKLEELANHKNTPNSVKIACNNAILKLMNSDWLIAKTSLEEAVVEVGADTHFDHEIALVEQKFQESYRRIEEQNYGSAIDLYRQAWEHAQKILHLC